MSGGAWSNDQLNSLYIYSATDGDLILSVTDQGFMFIAPNRSYVMNTNAFNITPIPATGARISMTTVAGFGGILFLQPEDSVVPGVTFASGQVFGARDDSGGVDSRPYTRIVSPAIHGTPNLHTSSVIVRGQSFLSPVDDSFVEITGTGLKVDGLINIGIFGAAPANLAAANTTNGTTSSSTFVNSLTTTGIHGTTFIAPPSGNVLVLGSALAANSTATSYATMDFEVRQGSSIGSGTVVRAATELTAGVNQSGTANNQGMVFTMDLVTGLTDGSTYNVCLTYHAASGGAGVGTAAYDRRHVFTLPMINS